MDIYTFLFSISKSTHKLKNKKKITYLRNKKKMSSLRCSGMQNIINGYLRYRSKLRNELLKEFQLVGNNPDV